MMDRRLLAGLISASGVAVLLVAWWLLSGKDEETTTETTVELRTLKASDAEELISRFEQLDYSWPPGGPLPPVAIKALPSDLNDLRVQDKKSVFFRTLAPLIAAENAALLAERTFLQESFADPEKLKQPAIDQRIQRIAVRYNVAGESGDPRFQRRLLTRVDVVPAALILAQAANESAWGTSRFAQEANNLFGIWTWNEDQGMEPLRRDPDATHFVRIYDDLRAAVRNYLYTINIGGAYEELRQARTGMRNAGKPLDAVVLAGGLSSYSERGQEYVKEIRSMIRYNNLDDLQRFEFRDGNGSASP